MARRAWALAVLLSVAVFAGERASTGRASDREGLGEVSEQA